MPKPTKHCPICFESLEVIELAPCDDCGWDKNEIEHFIEGKHSYSVYEVYGSELVHCNFCAVDFSSYDPIYWGFAIDKTLGIGSTGFQWLQDIPIDQLSISLGSYCPNCKARLTFLDALQQVRARNAES